MKKELPKPKKTLKSFILDEDAKIIDKTATKIAITASFLAINFFQTVDEGHAGWGSSHKNHSNHHNNIFTKEDGLQNNDNETIQKTFTFKDFSQTVEVTGKTIASNHGNHYNHIDGSSQGL